MGTSEILTAGRNTNSVVNQDINNGVRGKFPPDALEERYRLHAQRRLTKSPTIKTICAYFKKEHHIEVAEQSEKEWALKEKNSMVINEVGNDMIKTGEIQLPALSDELLMASLVSGAKDNAGIVKLVKNKTKELIKNVDGELAPYSICDITKSQYMEADKTLRNEYDKKAEMELKVQKTKVSMLKDISKVGKDASDSLLALIEKADSINKRSAGIKALVDKKAQTLSNARLKTNKDIPVGDVFEDAEVVESVRKMVGYAE